MNHGNLRVTVFGFIDSLPESPTKNFPSQFNAFHATPTDHLALARWLLYVVVLLDPKVRPFSLEHSHGNRAAAARELGLHEKYLLRLLKSLAIGI